MTGRPTTHDYDPQAGTTKGACGVCGEGVQQHDARRKATCGEVRPGNYANWVPVCDRPADHEGDHECPSPPLSTYLRRYWWSRDGLQQGMSA